MTTRLKRQKGTKTASEVKDTIRENREVAEMLRCNLRVKSHATGLFVTLPVAGASAVCVSHTAQMTAIISIPLKQSTQACCEMIPPRNVTVNELLPRRGTQTW